MRIARFTISGRPTVAIDAGEGFIDYGAVLEAHGYQSEFTGQDPERRVTRMLNGGMFDETFIIGELLWAKRSGNITELNTDSLDPLLPLRPCKIVCMARNWAAHAKEGGHEAPAKPVYFVKTENCAIGYGETIPLFPEVGTVHHEGEIAVVISKKASRIRAEEVGNYILGYTILNDITARSFQKELSGQGFPWYAAKSMDGFAPIGPWIVQRSEMEPLSGKRIRVTVNGNLRQDGTTDDMIFKVPQIIETITRHITLVAGDMVATGTPAGVGELRDGDEVVVEVDSIGRLVNKVQAVN